MRDDDIPIRCEMMKEQLGDIGLGLDLDKLFKEMYKEHANCILRFHCLAKFMKRMGVDKEKFLEVLPKIFSECPRFQEEGICWRVKGW